MGSPTYFPVGYFGGAPGTGSSGGGSTVVSTSLYGTGPTIFERLYSDLLDYELGTSDSAVLFTTARRKSAINDGLREFADLTECWQKQATIPAISGQAVYALTSTGNVPRADFSRITAEGPTYRYTDATGLQTYHAGDDFPRRPATWLNVETPGWPASTGTQFPEAWFVDTQDGAVNLTVTPPPSLSTGSTAVILLPYVAQPSSLVSTAAVPFTDTAGVTRSDLRPYHQALVHFAAHRLELLRKDRDASDRQMAKFMGFVQRFLQAMKAPAGTQIRPARNYFSGARARRVDPSLGPRSPWWT